MVNPDAVMKARVKVQDEADRELCLENNVCPECATDLKVQETTIDVIAAIFKWCRYCTTCKKEYPLPRYSELPVMPKVPNFTYGRA